MCRDCLRCWVCWNLSEMFTHVFYFGLKPCCTFVAWLMDLSLKSLLRDTCIHSLSLPSLSIKVILFILSTHVRKHEGWEHYGVGSGCNVWCSGWDIALGSGDDCSSPHSNTEFTIVTLSEVWCWGYKITSPFAFTETARYKIIQFLSGFHMSEKISLPENLQLLTFNWVIVSFLEFFPYSIFITLMEFFRL